MVGASVRDVARGALGPAVPVLEDRRRAHLRADAGDRGAISAVRISLRANLPRAGRPPDELHAPLSPLERGGAPGAAQALAPAGGGGAAAPVAAYRTQPRLGLQLRLRHLRQRTTAQV